MNRLTRDFSLRSGDGLDEDTEQLYERQALILDDNNDICDDEINSGQVRLRQQSDKERQRDVGNSGYELKNINSRPYRDNNNESNPVEFTYYKIQPNDSLQNICLRYACPINQVKRLNGLMTDQDFYGLRRLKLPLGKLGLLDDLLKQQKNGSQDLLVLDETGANQPKTRLVNCPGSALSELNRKNNSRFKPLLSTAFSSNRISDMNRSFQTNSHDMDESAETSNDHTSQMHNSSSSFRDFANGDTTTSINNSEPFQPSAGIRNKLPKHNFIKIEIAPDPSQVTVDDLLTDEKPVVANVFEDLDYHVEQAKAAAENYDQRASELVSGIESSACSTQPGYLGPRPSRIPELFFSGENFGLNIKRLVMLIFFVCFFIPLIYLSQAIRKDDHGSKTRI